MKIEVLVDIFINHFPTNLKEEQVINQFTVDYVTVKKITEWPRCYDNVRAVDKSQQDIVNECIDKMIEEESELLLVVAVPSFTNEGFAGNPYKPVKIKENVKCLLNTETKQFEKMPKEKK